MLKMNLEDIYIKSQWCDELLKEITEIKEAKYPDIYIDTGSKLNEALLVLEYIKKDLKMQEETLKERFDKAFYNMINAGNKLQELSHKVEYAGKLIQLNRVKQKQVKELLNNDN